MNDDFTWLKQDADVPTHLYLRLFDKTDAFPLTSSKTYVMVDHVNYCFTCLENVTGRILFGAILSFLFESLSLSSSVPFDFETMLDIFDSKTALNKRNEGGDQLCQLAGDNSNTDEADSVTDVGASEDAIDLVTCYASLLRANSICVAIKACKFILTSV